MKGLLVKDFKLLKTQRTFLLLIIGIAICMVFFSYDVTFVLGFLTFITSLLVLSTISYDELDNGNAFIFTLPISRKKYVLSKYLLGLLLGITSWALATILVVVVGVQRNIATVGELLTVALIILAIMLIIQAIMLPFQFKFGGEKGRIAIIVVFGGVFLIVIGITKLLEITNVDTSSLINQLSTMSSRLLISLGLVISFLLLAISLKISLNIMEKKEF